AACLVVLAAAVIGVALYKLTYLRDVPRGDVVYDVMVARNLARGDGFATNLLPLGALQTAIDRGFGPADPWPSLHKFVFTQALLAPLVRVLGASIAAARVGSFLPYLFLVWGVFAVLARATRSLPWALAFSVAFVAFDELNSMSLSG